MNTPNKKESAGLTLVEAVEALSSIADLEFDKNMGIAQQHEMSIQNTPFAYQTVHWLHEKDAGETINMIKNTFKVILNYLQDFYNHEYSYINEPEVIERIKTIMVLVGEAARKLDKYTDLFHKTHAKSVVESKEYKKLQEFYLTRISKKIDEGQLGKWILAISQTSKSDKKNKLLADRKNLLMKHVFIDLDSVKKDTEYELFYMKKEDGTRFFSPRLIRNLKLVSDFGEYFTEKEKEEDPFEYLSEWRDKVAHANAKEIIRSCRKYIENFYVELAHAKVKEEELFSTMRKLIMALMLAAHPHQMSLKNCSCYFYDFFCYLRELLHNKEYQYLVTYPPKKSDRLHCHLLELAHTLCKAIFTHLSPDREMVALAHGILQDKERSEHPKQQLHMQLSDDHAILAKKLKPHANGPIHLILETLEEGRYHEFDPLMQQNLPNPLFSLYIQDSIYRFVRWPSPTSQEFINKASVTDEFKGFLRSCATDSLINKCLIINYQDRIAWKERMRSLALEDLPDHETFARQTAVLTLSKESDFYYQAAPYHEQDDALQFMNELKKQVLAENGYFSIPEEMNRHTLNSFINHIVSEIHHLFFQENEKLSRNQRLDFIEIFYLFLELKIIECVKPDFIGVVCKDGVDLSSTSAALLFVFIKLLTQERLSENDREYLHWMLHAPALIYRERLIQQDRFNRFISSVKAIESTRDLYGRANFLKAILDLIGTHYHSPILQSKAVVGRSRDFF